MGNRWRQRGREGGREEGRRWKSFGKGVGKRRVKFEVERRRKKREDDLGCRWREEEGKDERRQVHGEEKEGKDF